MNQVLVNGIEKQVNANPEWSLERLINHLRERISTDSVLISSVLVDGIEITPSNEKELNGLKVSEVARIELITAHPRELAQETLQALRIFSDTLVKLCGRITQEQDAMILSRDFLRLVEGLQTLAETIRSVKRVLRIGVIEPVGFLEADLTSTLSDMLEAKTKKQTDFLKEIIQGDLTDNLTRWRDEGIPALIRVRDT